MLCMKNLNESGERERDERQKASWPRHSLLCAKRTTASPIESYFTARIILIPFYEANRPTDNSSTRECALTRRAFFYFRSNIYIYAYVFNISVMDCNFTEMQDTNDQPEAEDIAAKRLHHWLQSNLECENCTAKYGKRVKS